MNTRAKMRRTNTKTREWLKNIFKADMIWLKSHTRYDDLNIVGNQTFMAKDLFGEFDGIAIKDGITYYLQIKTNQPPTMKRYVAFCNKYKISALLITFSDRIKEPRADIVHPK